MHMQTESVLENEIHKILRCKRITQIQARWPDLVLIYKKKRLSQTFDFAVPVDDWENV